MVIVLHVYDIVSIVFFWKQTVTVCLLICYCRGITEARMAYLAVLTIVFLAVCPHGRHPTQPTQPSHTADNDTDETLYKELRATTLDADAVTSVVFWRHLHSAWLLLMLLLAWPQNIPLIAFISIQNMSCRHVATHLSRTDDCVSPISLTLLYLFNGQASFFYQVLWFVITYQQSCGLKGSRDW